MFIVFFFLKKKFLDSFTIDKRRPKQLEQDNALNQLELKLRLIRIPDSFNKGIYIYIVHYKNLTTIKRLRSSEDICRFFFPSEECYSYRRYHAYSKVGQAVKTMLSRWACKGDHKKICWTIYIPTIIELV